MKLRLVDTKKAVIYVLMLAMSLMSLPVQANSLVYDPFVRDATNRQNFEPGGKYHLFGSRGSTTDRKGKISVIPTASQNIGGLSLEQALIRGNITYNVKFSGHGHEVHGPFDNHASKSSSDKKGQALIGFTTYQLSWKGHEHHPADAYDGPQGSNFPAPTGARDEYSYGISGSAARVQVNFNDNRDTGQRFKDRVENAKNSVTEGTKDAWNKATTHNPELNRAGNAAEVVSAAAAGAGNFIGAGWELLGAGDVAQGASTLKDIAGMEALRALPPEEQLKAVRAITGAADGYDAANAAYARWAQQNPNAAAVVGAAGNIAEQVVSRGKGKNNSNIQHKRSGGSPALGGTDYSPSRVDQRVRDTRRDFGVPFNNHSVSNDGRSLPIKHSPNSSMDLHDEDGLKQRRYFDENGRAIEDIDYRHSDDGTHVFPHRHDWEWDQNGKPNRTRE